MAATPRATDREMFPFREGNTYLKSKIEREANSYRQPQFERENRVLNLRYHPHIWTRYAAEADGTGGFHMRHGLSYAPRATSGDL
jgi:hypothetical protein